MKRKQNKYGFTMAELLIVVAVLVVLFAVVFIAVQNYQKSMAQLEYDTIAKEIFFAAQNHLTTAESQGYYGFEEDDDNKYGAQDPADSSVYYYIVDGGNIDSQYAKMFDLMLPFGSIDETVRVGGDGCYLIRYQPSSATVMDVFYSRPDKRFGVDLNNTELSVLLSDYRANRKNQRGVVGWFGDAVALQKGGKLNTPVVEIHNEEKLWVSVQYTNTYNTDQLCLILTGKNSNAQCKIMLGSAAVDNRVVGTDKLTVILDDITTADMRFGSIIGQRIPAGGTTAKQFTPGEDIYVEAVAYNNDELTGVAYSGKQTTNSLFKGIYDSGTDSVAVIENFRHLENLSTEISGFNGSVTHAEQIQNLVWSGDGETSFRKRIASLNNDGIIPAGQSVLPEEQVSVYYYVGTGASPTATPSTAGTYLPVNAGFALAYSGKRHSVSNVIVNSSQGDAGLFGALNANSITIADLELIDFDIQTTAGNAGALAGSIQGTAEVSNVIAYNTSSFDNSKKSSGLPLATVSASANAGGLIGSLGGSSKIEYCAAALVVNSTGADAGGLIGTVTGGTINACYSGGHAVSRTVTAQNGNGGTINVGVVVEYPSSANVSAAGNAGGLVGTFTGSGINNSYSTCSVSTSASSAFAGGFVGAASVGTNNGGPIKNCYCTGKVSGGTSYAFSGTVPNLAGNRSYFFQIINPMGDDYMLPYQGYTFTAEHEAKMIDFDHDTGIYQNFVEDASGKAEPYNAFLESHFKDKYGLRSLAKLAGSSVSEYFVNIHYGDWPLPDTFVINTT